ncbi:MAG: SRPBCC domain-containing protein [Candidatus Marinimicrobia bacterium]|nr:SRPBCC domain-containing protein [Candidatus Neomarinimicrobiota bacterium]MCF7829141.1 SRPBCC domain-containing protein [Candidatus Neomarinimicrobiota bacterium]MCF7881206.1 SRPBCC domain-containing protein [Candidatus Neomarinimicrobiota bacterium]
MDHELTLTVSKTIDAPRADVWRALTDKELIQQYFYGTEAESDWEEGSPITFTGTWEGEKYVDKGTIIEKKRERLLKFSYLSSMSGLEDQPENYAEITYRLEKENGKTILSVTQQGFKDKEAYDHSTQGWEEVLGNLKALVEGLRN